MRIMHVLPYLGSGGLERLVIQLVADAVAHGDAVTVVSAEGVWVEQVVSAGAVHVPIPSMRSRSTCDTTVAAVRVARCLREMRPDLVHAHNVRATVMARSGLVLAGRRAALMPTLHGLAPSDYPGAARILRRLARRVIACAPSVARSLAAAGFPRERIDVITNGAALRPAGPDRQAALRDSLSLGPGPLVVGIGRLVDQKAWPVLIEAARHLDGPAFVVAGVGGLRADLEAHAASAGGRVRFVGHVDDIAALVGLASCVVSTSSWEGLPLALLEALSLGVPVVATAVDSITDLVPAEAALLIPAEDPAAAAVAINRILTDRDLAARLGRAALLAAPQWAPQEMLRRYRAAYRAAVA